MPTPKVITATDIRQGKLVIHREGSVVVIERRYQFLDAGSNIIEILAGGRLLEEIAISSLPANIVLALQDIDTWTYDQALAQEGMT